MNWLELHITQGSRFTPGDEHEIAGLIEGEIEVQARNVYCTSDGNQIRCYIRFDAERLPIPRLQFYNRTLLRAFQTEPSRSITDLAVVDQDAVARHIPEALH